MGVTGLWPVLSPSARPTPLPTLNRKRLAVDASIWIYQFLKAVRDQEGNALRNSHVVGFFRRICKLLYFGIKPVFVFDGGAPILKRQTVLGRKQRREGRREDAVRTAGKLLAVQMKRRGEEEEAKRKEEKKRRDEGLPVEDEEEPLPKDFVYVGEVGMSATERQQTRTFRRTDQYHLPDLQNGIEGMGQPNDPRIMSVEELEEYARQFNEGEDVNLYDFSKIDFDGEFFLSLPPGDRYNILNAARLRSRLRMGLSKEQLDKMFPNRMEFSKFQIQRATERNDLTQRLMNLNGMNDMAGVGGGRIAGERGREYVLVKNDGVEGGWALGVVSTDKSIGQREKPIDIEAMHQKTQVKSESDEEEEFEDVPVEGLNRLPKPKFADERRQFYESTNQRDRAISEEVDSLFVGGSSVAGPSTSKNDLFEDEDEELNRAIAMSLQQDGVDEEQDHLNKAIALSLQKNHGQEDSEEEGDFEDVVMPEYQQRAVEDPKPIGTSNGKMVAHIVNNRANAAIPKRKAAEITSDSDDEMDLQATFARARRQKAAESRPKQAAPVPSNLKNPFDGPLPFEKLDFRTSIFGKGKGKGKQPEKTGETGEDEEVDETAGGFDNDLEDDAPKPLPPWLAGGGDIRSQVEVQREQDRELNAEDRERADEEDRLYRKQNGPMYIDSSDDNDSDVEIVDKPATLQALSIRSDSPVPETEEVTFAKMAEDVRAKPPVSDMPQNRQHSVEPQQDLEEVIAAASSVSDIPQNGELSKDQREESEAEVVEWSDSDYGDASTKPADNTSPSIEKKNSALHQSASPEPEFEDVEMPLHDPEPEKQSEAAPQSPDLIFEDVEMPDSAATFPSGPSMSKPPALMSEESIARQAAEDAEFDLSDPDDEEMLAQLALETEAHAKFESTLNNKSELEVQQTYERDLKALRNQQKKDRRDADEVTGQMVIECQTLLTYFGIPYVTAPMEAEAQCAELVRLGLVDGVVTDDCDVFLFGGTRVYKNMFNNNKTVECYLSSDIEKELSMSREQLIAFAHLLGSDYTEGVPGIGPVTAVEILSEFPSTNGLEEFREWFSSIQHKPETVDAETSIFRKKFRKSQRTKLFLPPGFPSPAVTEAYLKPDVDSDPKGFEWGFPDLPQLREFLMAQIGWTPERVDEVLLPVIQDMNRRELEGTQANITHFFKGAVGAGAAVPNKERLAGSKRMQEAVEKLKAKKDKKDGGRGLVAKSYGDAGKEWAQKEKAKAEKAAKKSAKGGKAKQKRKAGSEKAKAILDAVDDEDEDEEPEVDEAADDESGSGDEFREERSRSTVKSKGKAKGTRKKAKV